MEKHTHTIHANFRWNSERVFGIQNQMLLTRCLLLWLQSYHWFNLRRNFSLFNGPQRTQLTQFLATCHPFWWMSVEMSEHRWMKSCLIHLCFFSFGGPITASVWGRLTAGQRHLCWQGWPFQPGQAWNTEEAQGGFSRVRNMHSYQVAKITPNSAEGKKALLL